MPKYYQNIKFMILKHYLMNLISVLLLRSGKKSNIFYRVFWILTNLTLDPF